MTEVKKYGRGRPKKGEVREGCFDADGYRKTYYEENKDELKTLCILHYYRKKYNMSDEEYELNIKLGLSPQMILTKLKEKCLIEKMKKLHGTMFCGLSSVGTVPTV
jgi:hypothetical protein